MNCENCKKYEAVEGKAFCAKCEETRRRIARSVGPSRPDTHTEWREWHDYIRTSGVNRYSNQVGG
jgi:hypothetical protein